MAHVRQERALGLIRLVGRLVGLRELGGGLLQPRLRREDLRFTGKFERLELPLAVFSLLLFTLLAVQLIVINKQILWRDEGDLARAYIAWGGYAYGDGAAGTAAHGLFRSRLQGVEGVIHNQDNREHDLLDSDDYYQFEGGLTAAVRHLSGSQPAVYHNDHSRPESPKIRTLEDEIARVVRARVVNPKWIAGVMRHGYKGAFEMAATVDYLFAFAATAHAVADHHFDAVFEAYLEDEEVRGFLADNNPAALREMAERLIEARERGLWKPRSNSAHARLAALTGDLLEEVS